MVQDDYEQVLQINQSVAVLHADAEPEIFHRPSPPFAVETPRENDHERTVLVAVNNNEVIGFCEASVHENDANNVRKARRVVHVDSIGILESKRGQGIGKKLAAELENWARERRCSHINLNVYQFNASARGFYERLGFKTLSVRMEKPVS